MSAESSRDWRLYADDILDACGKIRRYVAGMTYDGFAADDRTRDAVIRNIEKSERPRSGSPMRLSHLHPRSRGGRCAVCAT
jgi:hypothetical protein